MSATNDSAASSEMINPVICSRKDDEESDLSNSERYSGTTAAETESDDLSADQEQIPPDNDIITQTDKDGKPKRRAKQPASPPVPPQKISLLRQFFCCFCRSKGASSRSTQLTRPPRVTSPRSRRVSISGQSKLLPDLKPENAHKKCLALDLDETLVHSSFQYVENADFVIPVTIEDVIHNVYVIKRPGVDEFMRRMGAIYEIVIYTASLCKYADPLLDKLDIHKVINSRLFRESCVYFEGHYVKDLSLLNRDVARSIIVDNSPMSYTFHPEYAIDCGSFIDDPRDVEMWQIADFLEDLNKYDDVKGKTRSWREWCRKNPSLSTVPPKKKG